MMRILSFFLLFFGLQVVWSQSVPQSFSYQAIARDPAGALLANTQINLQMSILDGSSTGSMIYVERHLNISTNDVGHFQINVGEGTSQGGGSVSNFSDIDWGGGDRYLKVDIESGGTYANVGTSQLRSVPYSQATDFALNGKLKENNQAEELDFFGASGNSILEIGSPSTNPNQGNIWAYDNGAVRSRFGVLQATGAGYAFLNGSSGNKILELSTPSTAPNQGNIWAYDNGAVRARFGVLQGTNAGNIVLWGATGNELVYAGPNVGTNNSYGMVAVKDASGLDKASIFVNSIGQGIVLADNIVASGASGGVKNFVMPHPTQPGKEIWYASIEGPEAAAYERGTATLVNGEAEITFSEHFRIVANAGTMTITTSPWSADSKGLAVIERTATGFKVKELFGGTGNYQFDWRVDAKRKGHEDFQVIRNKEDHYR